jgi:hydroxymethylbilane synthase
MTRNQIKIGTRGSKLAIFQARQVKKQIELNFPQVPVEIIIIKTKGDKILDTSLSKIGDKGLFTKEIEKALLKGTIDVAVHSLKDLSTDLLPGLILGAVLERGEYRDALVHRENKKLNELTSDDLIATSSLRRIAGLGMICPSVQITDIRGNIDTRLQKMKDGFCHGMIMAAAGLKRLGLEENISELIEPEMLVPAVGQGAIAVECRNDNDMLEILEVINHEPTMHAVTAERAFLNEIQGGCQVPVGAIARVVKNSLIVHGFVSSLDGKKYIKESLEGNTKDAGDIGKRLAKKMVAQGGAAILDEVRKNINK